LKALEKEKLRALEVEMRKMKKATEDSTGIDAVKVEPPDKTVENLISARLMAAAARSLGSTLARVRGSVSCQIRKEALWAWCNKIVKTSGIIHAPIVVTHKESEPLEDTLKQERREENEVIRLSKRDSYREVPEMQRMRSTDGLEVQPGSNVDKVHVIASPKERAAAAAEREKAREARITKMYANANRDRTPEKSAERSRSHSFGYVGLADRIEDTRRSRDEMESSERAPSKNLNLTISMQTCTSTLKTGHVIQRARGLGARESQPRR